MIAAAAWPREHPEDERLLWIDPRRGRLTDSRVRDLPQLLAPGDLVVVNDAATAPASLRALRAGGTAFEVRLASHEGEGSRRWRAILFGRGDWRTRTEDRPPPPRLVAGERFRIAGGAMARVVALDPRSDRLVEVEFEGNAASMWRSIYEEGRPVQYAHVGAPLALWHVQSAFASRPWAVESPSAGRPLTFRVLERLRERGVAVASLTHAAGLSSSGDAALDALLPLDERYDLPAPTVNAIERIRGKRRGAERSERGENRRRPRIIAVGTTVTRALEGCAAAHDGALVAGEGSTDLRLDAHSRLRVVDGLLTGIHERGTSHFALMAAFASASGGDDGGATDRDDRDARHDIFIRALEHAERAGYLQHEFGDTMLVLPT